MFIISIGPNTHGVEDGWIDDDAAELVLTLDPLAFFLRPTSHS